MINLKPAIMPWRNGDYPPAMKNMSKKVRDKAVEIANALYEEGTLEEGVLIATAIKRAKEWAEKGKSEDNE